MDTLDTNRKADNSNIDIDTADVDANRGANPDTDTADADADRWVVAIDKACVSFFYLYKALFLTLFLNRKPSPLLRYF